MHRTYSIVAVVSIGDPAVHLGSLMQVNAGYCYDAGLTPPASIKPCNTAPCPAWITTWAVELWSACVPRYAQLVCHIESPFKRFVDDYCPVTPVYVIGDACCHVSACRSHCSGGDGTRTCGPGSMTRNVTCVDSSGKQLAASACQSPQPLSVSDCDLGLCQCSSAEDCVTQLDSDGLSQGAATHFECLEGECVCTSG